jgi:hypothetical protein
MIGDHHRVALLPAKSSVPAANLETFRQFQPMS